MANGSLVVRRHRPWKNVVLGLVAVSLLGLAGWQIYQAGLGRSAAERAALAAERAEFRLANSRLSEENTALRERLVMLERAEQVQRRAGEEVSQSLRALQSEIMALKEELGFYKGIVDSSRHAQGLTVQSFRVQPAGTQNRYRYRLVLTHVLKSDKVAEGTVTFSVAGEQAGQARVLSLAELSDAAPEGIKFQFRYFQKFEGQMTLPADFVPRAIEVQVTGAGKSQARVEKTFDWPRRLG